MPSSHPRPPSSARKRISQRPQRFASRRCCATAAKRRRCCATPNSTAQSFRATLPVRKSEDTRGNGAEPSREVGGEAVGLSGILPPVSSLRSRSSPRNPNGAPTAPERRTSTASMAHQLQASGSIAARASGALRAPERCASGTRNWHASGMQEVPTPKWPKTASPARMPRNMGTMKGKRTNCNWPAARWPALVPQLYARNSNAKANQYDCCKEHPAMVGADKQSTILTLTRHCNPGLVLPQYARS